MPVNNITFQALAKWLSVGNLFIGWKSLAPKDKNTRLVHFSPLPHHRKMNLSQEAIKEFKATYYEEYGERISDNDAQEMGGNLLSLFKIIYRPIPHNDIGNPITEHTP